MFKKEKRETGDVIILDKPIKIIGTDYEIKYFDLEKLNDEAETIEGVYFIIDSYNYKITGNQIEEFYNISYNGFEDLENALDYLEDERINSLLEDELNDIYYIFSSAMTSNHLLLKYKLTYKENDIYLIINCEYYNNDLLVKSNITSVKIDNDLYFKNLIDNLNNKKIVNISMNDIINNYLLKFKIDLFKASLNYGVYIKFDFELKSNIKIYKLNNKKKEKLLGISNRAIFDYTNKNLFISEVIKNKLQEAEKDAYYNIYIKINDIDELLFNNLTLKEYTNDRLNCYCFNIGKISNDKKIIYQKISSDYEFNNNIILNYIDYNYFITNIRNHDNKTFKFIEYVLKNNSDEKIKEFIKENKIKNIFDINIDEYLLYRGIN